jgi:hypothetical protein
MDENTAQWVAVVVMAIAGAIAIAVEREMEFGS